jgi:hypothetical protein
MGARINGDTDRYFRRLGNAPGADQGRCQVFTPYGMLLGECESAAIAHSADGTFVVLADGRQVMSTCGLIFVDVPLAEYN